MMHESKWGIDKSGKKEQERAPEGEKTSFRSFAVPF
jgi:hypothetical protein